MKKEFFAIGLVLFLFLGSSNASDLPECLSSMSPMVETQIVGNKIIVTLSANVQTQGI